MRSIEWPSLARALAWITALAFVAATVIFLLLSLDVFGAPPEPGEVFLDSILADFEWEQTIWPLEFAGTALFAVAFLGLAALGPVLSRLADETDARRGLVSFAFLSAGVLGATSQLIWLGARPVATSPQYCDCGLLAEEIMSRLMALNIVTAMQAALISGALVASAVGLLVAGSLGRAAGMPGPWQWLAAVGALISLVGAGLPWANVYPLDLIVVVLVAGIIVPIWLLWLAARARDVWPVGEGIMIDEEPAAST